MPTGTVKWFNDAKWLRFHRTADGGADVFAHFSAVQMEGFRTLKQGSRVSYELTQGPKGDWPRTSPHWMDLPKRRPARLPMPVPARQLRAKLPQPTVSWAGLSCRPGATRLAPVELAPMRCLAAALQMGGHAWQTNPTRPRARPVWNTPLRTAPPGTFAGSSPRRAVDTDAPALRAEPHQPVGAGRRRGLGIGGHRHAHRRNSRCLARIVCQRARPAQPDPRHRDAHAPRPHRHGRLVDAQIQCAPVDHPA